MIVRVLLAVAALAAAAWVGASLRAAQLEARAQDTVSSSSRGATLAQLKAGADLLERARRWAPDQAPVTDEAVMLAASRRQRRALELLNDLVAREPENPAAWSTLAAVARGSDPARARAALRRARELNPSVARR